MSRNPRYDLLGDALPPGAIVHAGRHALELDADPQAMSFRRDTPLRVAEAAGPL